MLKLTQNKSQVKMWQQVASFIGGLGRGAHQIVKPHIPSIKFPARAPGAAKDTATSSGLPKITETPAPAAAKAKPIPEPPSLSTKASAGKTIESGELPPKYRRKPLSQEEMEYIEKGGKV